MQLNAALPITIPHLKHSLFIWFVSSYLSLFQYMLEKVIKDKGWPYFFISNRFHNKFQKVEAIRMFVALAPF